VTPFRFLTGWIHNRTGSLFLVGLVHGMGNAVAGGSGFDTGLLAHLYPGQAVATMAHLLAFFVMGLIVLAATRSRLGHPGPSAQGARSSTTSARRSPSGPR
jgi:hypothetical protein